MNRRSREREKGKIGVLSRFLKKNVYMFNPLRTTAAELSGLVTSGHTQFNQTDIRVSDGRVRERERN